MPAPVEPIPQLAELDLRITTQRMIMRPIDDGDAEAIFAVASQPDFPRNMSWPHHTSINDTKDMIGRCKKSVAANTAVVWALEHAGNVVGILGLDTEWHFAKWRIDRAEIGYWLAPDMHSRGLMTEATIAAVTFAFDTLGMHKVVVRCLADNTPSRRVIEKCGFRFVGRAEQDVYRDGAWAAQLHYELLSSEWSDTTNTLTFSRPGVVQ